MKEVMTSIYSNGNKRPTDDLSFWSVVYIS